MSAREMRVGAGVSCPPFCDVDSSGKPIGLYIDLLQEIASNMNLTTYYQTNSWADAYQALWNNKIDILPLVSHTAPLAKVFDFSIPVVTVPCVLITRAEDTAMRSLSTLEKGLIAVPHEDAALSFLRQRGLGDQIMRVDSFEQALTALDKKRARCVIMIREHAHVLLRRMQLNERLAILPLPEFQQDLRYAVRRGDNVTLEIINRGLSDLLRDGTFRRLSFKWLSPNPGDKAVVIVGGDQAFPPYEYIDEAGNPAGYNVDIIHAVAKAVGIMVNVQLGPWEERLEDLRSGRIDTLAGALFTEQRAKTMLFSHPHTYNNYVAVIRRNGGIALPKSWDALQNKSIAVERGGAILDILEQQKLKDHVIIVKNYTVALQALTSGTCDVVLGPRMTILYYLNKLGLNNELLVGTQTFLSLEYCFATDLNNEKLCSQLNEGLKLIQSNGTYQEIQKKWFGEDVVAKDRFFSRRMLMILLSTVGGLLGLVMLGAAWVWILQHQVKYTTRRLFENERRTRTALSVLPLPMFFLDINDRICFWNRNAVDTFGWNVVDVYDKPITFIPPDSVDAFTQLKQDALRVGLPKGIRMTIRAKRGETIPVRAFAKAVHDSEGIHERTIIVLEDLRAHDHAEAERRTLQDRIAYLQKMESLGQLTGGIAHDFNNLLQVISGYADIIAEDNAPDSNTGRDITEILKSTERAKRLIQQLLGFSRQQLLKMEYLDLNVVAEDAIKLLKPLIGEHVSCHFLPGDGLGTIHADVGQLSQIITNLCINARDAMPNGGELCIETSVVHVDTMFQRIYKEMPIGAYVMLSVSDTGTGMTKETLDKIFEPFFTTKSKDKGTGLGLSMVYGLVQQHNGFIHVYSEIDRGTTFKLYFPRLSNPTTTTSDTPSATTTTVSGGKETLLLAEDDAQILRLTSNILRDAGYTVIETRTGFDAVEAFKNHQDAIDLLVFDVVMPKLSGVDAYNKIKVIRPDVRVLFCSGYNEHTALHANFAMQSNFRMLQKPYTRALLLNTIREVLDA